MQDAVNYLTGPNIKQRYKVTDMTVHRWLKNPDLDFPKPTYINGRRYWLESDLVEWERKRAAARAA